MTSLFTLASNDQSAYWLGQLFGSVGTVLQPQGATTPVLNIIGTMFQTLNTTALIIGSLLVTYTTVVGLLKTAQEGEFLGKHWNSMWVPLRMVIGIAALFPTGGGYSAIQIVFMWIILQGVAAGDSLWNTALNFIQVQGSPYATISNPSSTATQASIEALYQALVCADAARRTDTTPKYTTSSGSKHSYYYCADNPSDGFCTGETPLLSTILTAPSPSDSYKNICKATSDGTFNNLNNILTCKIGPNYNDSGACGSIQLGNYSGISSNCGSSGSAGSISSGSISTLACSGYQAQQAELAVIVATLEIMAKQTNQFDNDYIKFYENQTVYTNSNPPSAPAWIQRHCNDIGLNATSCCLVNEAINFPDMSVSTCLFPNPDTGLFVGGFTPDSNIVSGLTDYANSSKTTAQSLLLMCGLGPYAQPSYSASGCMGAIVKPQSSQGSNPAIACSTSSPCADGSACTSSSSTPGVCVTPGNGDFITGQVNNYNTALNNAAALSLSSSAQTNSTSISFDDMHNMGWANAGGYYYELAKQNNSDTQAAYPPFTVIALDPATDSGSPLAGYRSNVQASQYIIDKITGQTSSSSMGGNDGANRLLSKQQQADQGILTNFISNLTGGASPLVGMQKTGAALIITAQVLFGLTIGIAALVAGLSDITFMGLGTGIPTNPAHAAWNFIGWTLVGGIMSFCAWCIAVGGLLSIYTPLVPYIIFTFGVMGWFFSVVEAMTAAPFVALGILSPGGQHDLLGRAEPAMMLLANIFLRPTLMIMGMIVSMLFANIIVAIINSAFTGVMSSIYGNGTPDLVSLILFMTAYTMLIIGVLNKTFTLIDYIPDRVLTWVSGHAGQGGGASEALGQVKGGVDSAGDKVGGGMKSSGDTAKGVQDARMGAAKEREKQKDKTKIGGQQSKTEPDP